MAEGGLGRDDIPAGRRRRGRESTSAPRSQNSSTSSGSNWVPRALRATATAASTPPARWKTSAVSASCTSGRQTRSPRRAAARGHPGRPSARGTAEQRGRTSRKPERRRARRRPAMRRVHDPRLATRAPELQRPATRWRRGCPSRRGASDRPSSQPRPIEPCNAALQRDVVAEPVACSCASEWQPTQASSAVVTTDALGLVQAQALGQPSAIRHDRSTCSIGCPRPRSIPSESAATTSARRTVGSPSPSATTKV